MSDDATNSLKCSTKAKYASTVDYFKGLIALRAAHPAFRMSTASAVKANLKILNSTDNVIAYSLNGKAVGDKATTIVVIHNANTSASIVTLPNGKKWSILAKGSKIGTKVLESLSATKISVPGQTTMVLTQ